MNLAQGDFQLVNLVVARFVHARGLAGGADEHAAEQIAQAGVVVPVQEQAGQERGAAQKRAVGGRGAAHDHVVAAAGAGVAAVGHELFGRQAGLKRGLVQKFGVFHHLRPVVGGVDVDLDDTGVGRYLQELEARVARGRVAFHHDLDAQLACRGLYSGDQVQVIFQARQRRHEYIEHAAGTALFFRLRAVGAARVAHFHTHGGAHLAGVGLELFGRLWRRVVGGAT